MLINALQDNVALSRHTRVSGNISTAHSSQQLDTSSKVSKAQSYGQLVGSIPTNRESKFLGTVQTGDKVGTDMDSVASSGLSVTSSKLSDTLIQYAIFSSLLNYAVAVMVQEQTSNTVRQPQGHISDSLSNICTIICC